MLYPLSYGGFRTSKATRHGEYCRPTAVQWLRARSMLAREVARTRYLAPVAQALGRVLVVDDDEVIRQLIAVSLTLEGF